MAYNWGRGLGGAGSGALAGYQAAGPWGAAAGGGLGALSGFGDEDPEELLKNIPEEMRKYLEPYLTAGNKATGEAGNAYGEMLNDPNAIISRIGAGYKQSPGYQFKLGQGLNAMNNANAAGGMVGTNQNKQQDAELAEHLADQDYNDYMKNALGIYGEGAKGEMGLSNQGYSASSDLANSIAGALGSRSTLRYSGNANRNQMASGLMQALLQYAQGKGGNNSTQTTVK